MPAKRVAYDWTLEILTLLCFLASFYPLLFYASLGEDVLFPVHYNINGEIDGWGGRRYLLTLSLVNISFYIILSIFEKYYKWCKYPFKVKDNDPNSKYIYRDGVRLMRHMKFFIVLILSYFINSFYAFILGKGNGPNNNIMVLLLIGLVASVIIYSERMLKYRK